MKEKLGVVTSQDSAKTASIGPQKCPVCGNLVQKVNQHVTSCIQCGTKPFEVTSGGKEEERD